MLQSAVAAMCLPRSSWGQTAKPPMVDTHTHFYDPRRAEGVPWPARDDTFLYRPVLPAEYRKLTEPLGITGTVVVEASARVADNHWILDLAAKEPFLLGLVGNLAPGTPDFAEHFPTLSAQKKFVGIRVSSGPLGQGLDKPEFLADLERLSDAGRELDINVGPDLLPLVDTLATKLPDLRIVINHLANVRIDGPALDAIWLRDLKAVAKHPQVYLKVSALVEGASQGNRVAPVDPAYYKPVLDAVWDVFGDERVIYGSNWPVSARYASYDVVQRIVQEHANGNGAAASARFFHANAKAAYRWPEG
jgi:predicted TIM-barrel fold metal-dependent hydrolase